MFGKPSTGRPKNGIPRFLWYWKSAFGLRESLYFESNPLINLTWSESCPSFSSPHTLYRDGVTKPLGEAHCYRDESRLLLISPRSASRRRKESRSSNLFAFAPASYPLDHSRGVARRQKAVSAVTLYRYSVALFQYSFEKGHETGRKNINAGRLTSPYWWGIQKMAFSETKTTKARANG